MRPSSPAHFFAYADIQSGLHLARAHRRLGILVRQLCRQSHGYRLDGCPISTHILASACILQCVRWLYVRIWLALRD